MKRLFGLDTRANEPELMDLPDVDIASLKRTVEQFELINRLLSATTALLRSYLLARTTPGRRWRVLDVGAGGCDIVRWLVREGRSRQIEFEVHTLDIDKHIVQWSREWNKGYPEISVHHGDALDLRTLGMFDFIISNHFFHHLKPERIIELIGEISRHCRVGFVINDLRRSAWALVGYSLFASIFARRSLALHDGRLSIRKGFSEEELEALVEASDPIRPVDVRKAFPARVFITDLQQS